MQFDDDVREYSAEERLAMSQLPRETEVPPGEADALVRALQAEGMLGAQPHAIAARPGMTRAKHWLARAAAVVALLSTGAVLGARWQSRGSLEAMLRRTDLNSHERILLLQRAGSAYVAAANSYAAATEQTDSTATEVARQVLIGAAHAVARADLDGGLAPGLTAVLASSRVQPGPPTQPVIWF